VDPTHGLDAVEKRKFLTLPGLELQPLGVQPVGIRDTDCATLAANSVRYTLVWQVTSNSSQGHSPCILYAMELWWVNWATLSLGDINTEIWSSRLRGGGVGLKLDDLALLESN
jgi:hypothetical protein